ncbi:MULTISPECIES: hypothetical protein [Burkholderia]|uniref:hypothetical protein n=1 Tax=Burkholderia TaxID=32008 RepID=UPI000AB32D3C|nr:MULTISPECIES: hypothetical protein [Burkholderia]
MLILGFKPGHDGHIASLENGVLKFSYEAEKDTNPRYAPVDVDLLIDACRAVDRIPDVIAVSGWSKGIRPDQGAPIGGGYLGLARPQVLPASFFGNEIRRITDSHERSHIMCAYGMSPFPQGQACYVLVWEGHIGSFYFVDEYVNIERLCEAHFRNARVACGCVLKGETASEEHFPECGDFGVILVDSIAS